MANVTRQELLDKYHDENSFSFGSKKHIKDKINISDSDLEKVLSHSDVYTGFKQFQKSKLLPPIRTYKENYLWEADLMFFTHPDFVKANEGNLYILAMIDTFTKMVRLTPLRTKDTKTVTARILHVFNFDKP